MPGWIHFPRFGNAHRKFFSRTKAEDNYKADWLQDENHSPLFSGVHTLEIKYEDEDEFESNLRILRL